MTGRLRGKLSSSLPIVEWPFQNGMMTVRSNSNLPGWGLLACLDQAVPHPKPNCCYGQAAAEKLDIGKKELSHGSGTMIPPGVLQRTSWMRA